MSEYAENIDVYFIFSGFTILKSNFDESQQFKSSKFNLFSKRYLHLRHLYNVR